MCGFAQLKAVTDFHEFLDFFVNVIVAYADYGIVGDVFQFLLLGFLRSNEFDERIDATFVAVIHAINLIHTNANRFGFFMKHADYRLVRDVVFGNGLDNGLVPNVTGIILDNVVFQFLEQRHNKMGFAGTRRAIDVDAAFACYVTFILLKMG